MRAASTALLALLLSPIAACDSAESNAPLASGEFEATATGAIERRLRGDASFTELEQVYDTLLTLRFHAGDVVLPGRPYSIATGAFFSVPWSRESGTYMIDRDQSLGSGHVALGSSSTYGAPIPRWIEYGSVTVTASSPAMVEGIFDVTASNPINPEAPLVRVRGSFLAERAPIE